jgi:hypothetical protein
VGVAPGVKLKSFWRLKTVMIMLDLQKRLWFPKSIVIPYPKHSDLTSVKGPSSGPMDGGLMVS